MRLRTGAFCFSPRERHFVARPGSSGRTRRLRGYSYTTGGVTRLSCRSSGPLDGEWDLRGAESGSGNSSTRLLATTARAFSNGTPGGSRTGGWAGRRWRSARMNG